MSTRNQGSTGESLSEALARVIVTRNVTDHRETFDWATQEGRGDRMPRFLERAIEDVPHPATADAGRPGRGQRAPARVRRDSRAGMTLSLLAAGVGIGISIAGPTGLGPIAQRLIASTAFATHANAATPRMAFGEALRAYSQQAVAEAESTPVLVRNLSPGATLSVGTRVSDTEWSLAQSELDNLVITFPQDAPPGTVHANVEIPANAKAPTDGTFNVELRQAEPPAPEAASTAVDPATAAAPALATQEPLAETAKPAAVEKASTKADDSDAGAKQPATKRKSRPAAAYVPKKPATNASGKAAEVKPVAAITQVAASQENSALRLPDWSVSSFTPNQLTMFGLGGPVAE